MGRFSLLAKAWGVSEAQAKRIVEDAPGWFGQRADIALDQPSRAAGRFGRGAAGPVGTGLKVGGGAVGLGAGTIAASDAYKTYSDKKIADAENEIDQARADAMSEALKDPNASTKEKMELIQALKDSGFFDDTNQSPENWMQKLGIEGGGLNPVNFFGGGMTGVIVFLIVVWAVVRIAQSR